MLTTEVSANADMYINIKRCAMQAFHPHTAQKSSLWG